MHKILIIEGMHRSGSSLITQWLNKCGLHIGENLLKPTIGNVEGHFEDFDFIKLHEEFLEIADLPGTGLTDEKPKNISPYHRNKLNIIIDLKNSLHDQWAWKDPRTCLFLNTYRKALPNAYHLILTRSFDTVVSSLVNRIFQVDDKKYLARKPLGRWIWANFRRKKRQHFLYHRFAEHFLKVWINYNEEILKHVKRLSPKQFIVVDYLTLLKDEKSVFLHITDEWRFDLHYYDFNKIYKENLLSKPLDIKPFIKDKTLIAKAKGLEASLNQYIFSPQHIKAEEETAIQYSKK
jgi:hypothetical protein